MGTFGERLQDSLTIGGLSQTALAERCGVSRQTVRHWTRMRTADLSGTHIAMAGVALNVSIRWLALGTGNPTPSGLAELRNPQVSYG